MIWSLRRTYPRMALVVLVIVAQLAVASRGAEAFTSPADLLPPITGGAVVGSGLGSYVAGTTAGIGLGSAVVIGTGVGIVVGLVGFAAYKFWWADGHDPDEDSTIGGGMVATWPDFAHGSGSYVVWESRPVQGGSCGTVCWTFQTSDTYPRPGGCSASCLRTDLYYACTAEGVDATLGQNTGAGGTTWDGGVTHTWEVSCSAGTAPTRIDIKVYEAPNDDVETSLGTWEQESGSPDRYLETEAQCSDGSTVASQSTTYTESSGNLPSIPGVVCPSGTTLDGLTVTRHPVNAGEGDPTDLVTYTRPSTVDSPYRECFTPSSLHFPCQLQVQLLQPDGSLKPCTSGGECEGWSVDPDRASKYACTWGPYVLDLGQCYALQDYYDPATTGTLVETPLQDPEPGEVPQAEPSPTLDPTTPTQPGPEPTTLDPETDILGEPETVETGEGECFPSGWGLLNPIEWVLRPTKCALQWAFVPSATTTAQLQSLRTRTATKAPVQQITAIGTYFGDVGDSLSDSQTCWNVTANLTTDVIDLGGQDVVDTCGDNVVYTTLVSWRPVLGFLMYSVLFVPLGWWAWRQYAPGSQGVA